MTHVELVRKKTKISLYAGKIENTIYKLGSIHRRIQGKRKKTSASMANEPMKGKGNEGNGNEEVFFTIHWMGREDH